MKWILELFRGLAPIPIIFTHPEVFNVWEQTAVEKFLLSQYNP